MITPTKGTQAIYTKPEFIHSLVRYHTPATLLMFLLRVERLPDVFLLAK